VHRLLRGRRVKSMSFAYDVIAAVEGSRDAAESRS
jgi:hypothetical protein